MNGFSRFSIFLACLYESTEKAVVITPGSTSVLLVSELDIISFLCGGQTTVRQAVLYQD